MKIFMRMPLNLIVLIFMLSCGGYRTSVDSTIQQSQPFKLPFFEDAEVLSRELGLLRLRAIEEDDNIVVLGGLAAGYTLQAMMADTSDSSRSLELARQFGLRCLRTSSGFESLLQSRGLRVTPKAVHVLSESPELKHCQQWTGIAWSLWLLERGVLGAAIDVKSVQAMSPEKPKSSYDFYQHALRLALEDDENHYDDINRALSLAVETSDIPNRMYYEQWRLGGANETSQWVDSLTGIDTSRLNGVDIESIRRVLPNHLNLEDNAE